jgi:hypothetical protein
MYVFYQNGGGSWNKKRVYGKKLLKLNICKIRPSSLSHKNTDSAIWADCSRSRICIFRADPLE